MVVVVVVVVAMVVSVVVVVVAVVIEDFFYLSLIPLRVALKTFFSLFYSSPILMDRI